MLFNQNEGGNQGCAEVAVSDNQHFRCFSYIKDDFKKVYFSSAWELEAILF